MFNRSREQGHISASRDVELADPNGASSPDDSSQDSANEDLCSIDSLPVPENIYGFALMVLTRDSHLISHRVQRRILRQVLSLLLIAINMGIQVYLLLKIKKIVIPPFEADIRSAYHTFRENLGNHSAEVTPELFASMSDELKDTTCHIPLTEPGFLGIILFIWTLTVCGELRMIYNFFTYAIVRLETVPSMEQSMKAFHGADEGLKHITGLTVAIKFFLFFLVIVPRFAIAVKLLWIGCQWLTATTDFDEIVLNGVALEFVLMTKDLMYVTIVSSRSQKDVENTRISTGRQIPVTYTSFVIETVGWLIIALAWVAGYMFWFQSVLPDYQWDVSLLCEHYLQNKA
eukprot:TRINITY_DN41192_c0_g1_i1.p1 TRINITY_DN41192_c0_g1~~TRINITY_DN41192_c0_g1_i1.p1  ORF type:complete len:345 (-),score=50.85 TRINITY_DN41192_c0_g1_i1:320-1354(-)